jgi:hypothetical protein
VRLCENMAVERTLTGSDLSGYIYLRLNDRLTNVSVRKCNTPWLFAIIRPRAMCTGLRVKSEDSKTSPGVSIFKSRKSCECGSKDQSLTANFSTVMNLICYLSLLTA